MLCAVCRVDDAMPRHRTGYDRHDIHILRTRQKSKETMKNKSEERRTKKVSCPPEGNVEGDTKTSKRNNTTTYDMSGLTLKKLNK